MILVMRLLDMTGLRMPVLPVAIDWNANIQLPVGLFGVGLEGAAACFDDGPVAVEAAAQAESRVIGCDGVAGGDADGVRVEGDADSVPFARVGVCSSSESMTSCVWPMARMAASRNSSSCCRYSCSSAGMPLVPVWSMRRIR